MSQRAKYVGPHDEVEVFLPNGTTVLVAQGHQLPIEDRNGDPIPGEVHASLLEQADAWTGVNQSTGPKKGE
jgi:hypothetical protein